MIYLDYAATTPVRPEVREAMLPWLTNSYGNPSSHHALGRRAAEEVWKSRETIASIIHCDPDEIFFTSGGSESNTWAMDGLYCIDNGGHILMSNIEHHSLLNVHHKKHLIGVDKYGVVDLAALVANLEYNTPVVAVMMANNEIGTIQPIDEIDQECYKHETFLHVDAVQAFGHIPIDLSKYQAVSTMSASAHKIGGPKGVGFLYIQKDVQKLYRSLISGGQQEFGKRGGTENVAGIVGFAKAAELAENEMQEVNQKNYELIEILWSMLRNHTNISLNGKSSIMRSPDKYLKLPNNLNIRIDGVRAEELQELLSSQDIYVSTGSACNSDSNEPSHVLKSIGLTDDEANSSIRISLGRETTKAEIEEAGKMLLYDIDLLN